MHASGQPNSPAVALALLVPAHVGGAGRQQCAVCVAVTRDVLGLHAGTHMTSELSTPGVQDGRAQDQRGRTAGSWPWHAAPRPARRTRISPSTSSATSSCCDASHAASTLLYTMLCDGRPRASIWSLSSSARRQSARRAHAMMAAQYVTPFGSLLRRRRLPFMPAAVGNGAGMRGGSQAGSRTGRQGTCLL